MIKEEIEFYLIDFIMCLSDIIDLISPAINNHHKRVAYISLSIAEELKLPLTEQNNIMMAGALHDIGALSLKQKLEFLEFESEGHEHGRLGYQLLKTFPPLEGIATLVRFHHVPWKNGQGATFEGNPVPMGSHILHLADRVSVLINPQENILAQIESICARVSEHSGERFAPDLVDAFVELARKEFFWFDVVSPFIDTTLCNKARLPTLLLNLDGFVNVAKIFSHIIDFRSRFTSTHSCGVAVTCRELSKLIGFSETESRMIEIAGYLHDLGKLAVPPEILEKPTRLTSDEFNLIRSHAFHTYRSLGRIRALSIINAWASFHHERMDGNGYPFHHSATNLSLGARIVAIADVFTALTEDRPYRKGMSSDDAIETLEEMATNFMLDPLLVATLKRHSGEINSIRLAAQQTAAIEYHNFFLHEAGTS
jgi:HD-GYP domain-containing protein (c-di-GMP phosphodiesterase class II)